MNDNELKPVNCGCGGEAAVNYTLVTFLGKDMRYCVRCEDCGIMTNWYHTEAEAIEAWNKAMGGVVTYPSTTPNGVYTSGCTTTNTTDPNEDFHPVRDFMVNPERTAKVENISDYRLPINDYCFIKKGDCGNCGFVVTEGDKYCRECGAKLEWNE